ncbi:MAG TPA: c-type cytochrome, partial [Gemmataceae bacterium]
NRDRLERVGSGYVAHHAKDFLLANDAWFRGLGVHAGPDGSVYVSDWTDTGECHNHEVVDQTNGRIYKIVHGTPKPWRGDLAALSDAELVKLQTHPNDWFVRRARRLLQERAAAGKLTRDVLAPLEALVDDDAADARRRLRALWALHSVGALKPLDYLRWTKAAADPLAVWAVRLFFDVNRDNAADLYVFELSHGPDDLKHPAVQLSLASAVQWVPPRLRSNTIHFLLGAVKDGHDFNLAQLIWLAIEPTVPERPDWAVGRLDEAAIPWVRECIARRMAPLPAGGDDRLTGLDRLARWLTKSDDTERQADVLRGIQFAFVGRREVAMPADWPAGYKRLAASPSASVRDQAMQLAVLFGDGQAIQAVRRVVLDTHAALDRRRAGLQILQQRQRPDLVPVLTGLLADRDLRGQAVVALAAFEDPAIPGLILRHYAAFTDTEKAAAVATLAARPASALALLDAIERGTVSRGDVSAYAARQIQGLKDMAVTARLEKVLGRIKPVPQAKRDLIGLYKSALTADAFKAADPSRGRAVFAKTCATCHRLFDDGAAIGPDLTGSQRANIDYLLENIVDPNALVPREYRVTRFTLKSGRVVDGLAIREDAGAVTVRTPTEELVVPKAEIGEREVTEVSLMPEGLLDALTRDQVRDLVAYLASAVQVPLPK